MSHRPGADPAWRHLLDEALQLLGPADPDPSQRATALPELLAECHTRLARPRPGVMIRSLHHLACSGGTMISRCIAAQPNVQLISELDPLSQMGGQGAFAPTDLIRLARHAARPVETARQLEIFWAGLAVLAQDCVAKGYDLVLRDHPHGAFHFRDYDPERPVLLELLRPRLPLRALVTVRHPLDAYLGLCANGWQRMFQPSGLDEYARRCHLFLDRHAGVEILRYEDFLADPEARMRWICGHLALGWSDNFLATFQAIRLSGNSGRGGARIAPHLRRAVPPDLQIERQESPHYANLCARLGYPV